MSGKWKHELIFIKRDENGVIIGISEQTPEDYVDADDEDTEKITSETRFRIYGD